MSTLAQDIAALAEDEAVKWAVGVLRDKGINGVMYDKLISFKRSHPWPGYCQTCFAALNPPDSTSCRACGADDLDD